MTRFLVSASAICLASLSHAAFANFDDLSEGDFFSNFTNGGVTFSGAYSHQSGLDPNFTIEGVGDGSLAGQTLPNVLTFNGYSPGDGASFGAVGGFQFTSGENASTAGLDLWAFAFEEGNTITLSGFHDADLVGQESWALDDLFEVSHHRFDLAAGNYTSFTLTSSGSSVEGDSFISLDNVSIQAVPEPASLAVLGFGAAALLKRRRR